MLLFLFLQRFCSFFVLLKSHLHPPLCKILPGSIFVFSLFFFRQKLGSVSVERTLYCSSSWSKLRKLHSQNPFVIVPGFYWTNVFTVSQFQINLHFIAFANPEDSCDGTFHRIFYMRKEIHFFGRWLVIINRHFSQRIKGRETSKKIKTIVDTK